MAVIRKRKGSYQVIIRKVGHQPLTKSFKLHSEAQRFAKAVEGKFVEDDYLLNLSAKNKYPNFRTCLERYREDLSYLIRPDGYIIGIFKDVTFKTLEKYML